MNGTVVPAREYSISQDESERLRIIKIWFSIMVVFIHSYAETVDFAEGRLALNVLVWLDWLKYVLSQVIARCAVPGFFFMSAVFLYRRDFTWAGNLRKKVRTLLVPYLLINTAWIAIIFIVQHIGALSRFFSNPDNFVTNWTAIDWLDAYGITRSDAFVYPLWFIRDLLVLNVLAVLIKRLIDRFPRLVLLALTAMMLFGVETHIPVLGRDSIVFFSLGYYFIKYDFHASDVDKLDPVLLAGLYGIAVALDCTLRDMPQQCIVRPFSIVLGVAFFMRFATKVNDPGWKKKLLALSGYALPVYLFHELNLGLMRLMMMRFLPATAFFQAVEYFVVPSVIIALCVAGSWLLKKWMPRLYAVLTGGRTM